MKKLQNNFTTPEQSERLLELGVPADSADCYFYDWDLKDTNIKSRGGLPQIFDWFERDIKKFKRRKCTEMYPCWSVLQLIKICLRCSTLEQRQVLFFCNGDDDYYDFMSYIINVLESEIMTNHMDFSKLEE